MAGVWAAAGAPFAFADAVLVCVVAFAGADFAGADFAELEGRAMGFLEATGGARCS